MKNKREFFFFQVFRLRKVRHEHLNLYTGVCSTSSFDFSIIYIQNHNLFIFLVESPNLAIASK